MDMLTQFEDALHKNFPTNDSEHLKVFNESHLHHVPQGAQTHFRIEIVSKIFNDMPLLKRHRLVQEMLQPLLEQIKACSLHTLTPAEWEKKGKSFQRSPSCVGH